MVTQPEINGTQELLWYAGTERKAMTAGHNSWLLTSGKAQQQKRINSCQSSSRRHAAHHMHSNGATLTQSSGAYDGPKNLSICHGLRSVRKREQKGGVEGGEPDEVTSG